MHCPKLLDLYKIDNYEEQSIKKWPCSTTMEEEVLKKAKQSLDNQKLQRARRPL